MIPKKYSKRDGYTFEETTLSKKVIAGIVVYFFTNPVFPEYIYIALDDCSICGRGDVVNLLDHDESSMEFVPLARIDELVLNVPTQDDFCDYFIDRYGKINIDDISKEMAREFWDNFVWEFALNVKGINIEWSR